MSTTERALVAIYGVHDRVHAAVQTLGDRGFDLDRVSIVGPGHEGEHDVTGYYTVGNRMKHWGRLGAFWGGLWGLLAGAAYFAIPGLGPIVVAGPLVALIVAALEGAGVIGGVGALAAGLASLGIPSDRIARYEAALRGGKLLLLAQGSADEIERARQLLEPSGADDVALYGEERRAA